MCAFICLNSKCVGEDTTEHDDTGMSFRSRFLAVNIQLFLNLICMMQRTNRLDPSNASGASIVARRLR